MGNLTLSYLSLSRVICIHAVNRATTARSFAVSKTRAWRCTRHSSCHSPGSCPQRYNSAIFFAHLFIFFLFFSFLLLLTFTSRFVHSQHQRLLLLSSASTALFRLCSLSGVLCFGALCTCVLITLVPAWVLRRASVLASLIFCNIDLYAAIIFKAILCIYLFHLYTAVEICLSLGWCYTAVKDLGKYAFVQVVFVNEYKFLSRDTPSTRFPWIFIESKDTYHSQVSWWYIWNPLPFRFVVRYLSFMMGQHDGIVEFYITCNPPLLSRGVKHIIESSESACPNVCATISFLTRYLAD